MDLSYDSFQSDKSATTATPTSSPLNLSFDQFQAEKSPTYGITPPAMAQNFPGTTQTLADLQIDPLSLQADPHKAFSDATNALVSSDQNLKQSLNDLFSSKSISEGVGNTGKVVARAGGVLFSPLSALFSAANDIPGVGTVSKLITLPFQAVGEAAPHVSNTVIDALPISDQAKANLKPGIGEIMSLASQIALGETVDIGLKKADLEGKYGKADAQTIVDKAQELAKEKQNAPVAAPTTPTTDLSYEAFQKSPEAQVSPTNSSDLSPTSIRPSPETPVNTSEQPSDLNPTENLKPSKIGLNIQAKAIENDLTSGFKDTAGYNPITIKDQAEKIANLINEDPAKVRDMVNGKEPIPQGISGTYLIKAMEDYAYKSGDVRLLKDLATSPLTSETSVHAQELRMAAEREQGSPVKAIQDIMKAREESSTAKIKNLPKVKEDIVNEIKTSIRKTAPTRITWNQFVESIKC